MPDVKTIETVKKSRTSAKGQITNSLNKLTIILEADDDARDVNDIETQCLILNCQDDVFWLVSGLPQNNEDCKC